MEEKQMSDKMFELALDVLFKTDAYYNEFAKEHGKKGFIYLTDDESGQTVIYTRGEYKAKLLEFLATLE